MEAFILPDQGNWVFWWISVNLDWIWPFWSCLWIWLFWWFWGIWRFWWFWWICWFLRNCFFSAKTGDSVESCDSNASFKTDDTDDSWGPSFLNKVPQTIRARVETPPGNAQIPVREFERASLLPIYQFRFSFLLTMTSAQCHWFMSINDDRYDWSMTDADADIWQIFGPCFVEYDKFDLKQDHLRWM